MLNAMTTQDIAGFPILECEYYFARLVFFCKGGCPHCFYLIAFARLVRAGPTQEFQNLLSAQSKL